MASHRPYLLILAAHTALKLLLVPAYHSTDFEVHRNWLSLTYTQPLSRWYSDTASPWTLDYPPLFAWFERALAQLAPLFDARMLERDALGYASDATVLFQRLTVVASDLVLFVAVRELLGGVWRPVPARARDALVDVLPFALVFCDVGLLLVDHVHFQYNGLLLGVLLLACAAAEHSQHALAALWFALLLQLKQLYLTLAPLFFVYLLRVHCFAPAPAREFLPRRFAELGAVVAGVTAASIAPLAAAGGGAAVRALLARLFPFGERGLTHTYWAPNVWALYLAADCAAVMCARAGARVGVRLPGARWAAAAAAGARCANTAGAVAGEAPVVLPAVPPAATAALVLALSAPALRGVWSHPRPHVFRPALASVALGSCLGGWHVHEKAFLAPVLLLGTMALRSGADARAFGMLAAPVYYAVLPLLFEPDEYPLRTLALCTYALGFALASTLVSARARPPFSGEGALLASFTRMDRAYLLGFAPLELYTSFGHAVLAGTALPFLPLMLTSVYCALGVLRAAALAHGRLEDALDGAREAAHAESVDSGAGGLRRGG